MNSITKRVTYIQDDTDELASGYFCNGQSAGGYDLKSLNPPPRALYRDVLAGRRRRGLSRSEPFQL